MSSGADFPDPLMSASTPTPEQFDLVVIGAGPAGEKGAAQAAYFGKRVCVIERAPKPGGVALNAGAVPALTLRESARRLAALRRAGPGISVHVDPGVGLSDLMVGERDVIAMGWELVEENFERHAIASIQGSARFLDTRTVEVTRYGKPPRYVTGDAFLVATGSRPDQHPMLHVDASVVHDWETILTVDRIPGSMIVVGGGKTACEYASVFAALGTRVTIINERPRLLGMFDPELADALRQRLTGHLGVAVHSDVRIASAEVVNGERANVVLADGTSLVADVVLSCIGRLGNSAGLGLEGIGAHVDQRGFVKVDHAFRAVEGHIYAVGDLIGWPGLASTAMEQGRVAVCHAFQLTYKQRMAESFPVTVWSIPEAAAVGEHEEVLAARGIPVETGRAHYRYNTRGRILGDIDGYLKLVFHAEDRRVLGVSALGDGATELVHVGQAVMGAGGTIDYFIESVFGYPTLAEMYKYAAYDGLQRLARRAARSPGLPAASR